MNADQSATGPREAPDHNHILWDIGRMVKGAFAGKPVYGLCPAGCGCVWRDNFDAENTMSLGINQRSCVVCEPMAFNQLIPLFAKQMPDMSPPDLLQYRKRPKYAEGGTWSPWIDCTEDQAKDYMNLSSSWLYEVRQLRLIPGANP